MMVGFACRETPELMPLPVATAHKLCHSLAQVRKDNTVPYLRPDGKSQVTIEYSHGMPKRVVCVVLGAHHDPGVERKTIEHDLIPILMAVPVDMVGAAFQARTLLR
jgi:S-adenosylmethionine synthetase